MSQPVSSPIISPRATGGKAKPSETETETKTKTKTRSFRAGLHFPVGRVHRVVHARTGKRVGALAPVLLAATLEYLLAEILELSAKAASDHKRLRITPRHIMLAIRHDAELALLIRGMTIIGGGVLLSHVAAKSS